MPASRLPLIPLSGMAEVLQYCQDTQEATPEANAYECVSPRFLVLQLQDKIPRAIYNRLDCLQMGKDHSEGSM